MCLCKKIRLVKNNRQFLVGVYVKNSKDIMNVQQVNKSFAQPVDYSTYHSSSTVLASLHSIHVILVTV